MANKPLDLTPFEGVIHGHPIPGLLAEVRRLRAALAQAEATCDEVGLNYVAEVKEVGRLRAALAQAETMLAETRDSEATLAFELATAQARVAALEAVADAARGYLQSPGHAAWRQLRDALAALPPREEAAHE